MLTKFGRHLRYLQNDVYRMQLSPKGEVNRGGYVCWDMKHWGVYLPLFTDPEGDSCFSIYQISWIKLKKVIFWQLEMSLSRNFVYSLQTFRGFCQVHFTILLQIQHENNFLPTIEHRQAKIHHFFGICLYNCFIYQRNFIFQKCLETRRQGCFELWEPIKTRKNCCSLIFGKH